MKIFLNEVFFLLLVVWLFVSCSSPSSSSQDKIHYSEVFHNERHYRIYLPANYNKSNREFSVIYFFHGWGGRHFEDPSAHLDYEYIEKLVDKYQLIMVMWDGKMDDKEKRPYNIGDHHDVKYDIQMSDYFPELVQHIDSNYRTVNNRNNRGIIGFSMGGFMSFYIAGKYPEMVSAAVNIVGSPDFFVGLPENHTHYPVKYTFDNLADVGLLFINRSNCPMVGLNDEVHNGALWENLENYEYRKLEGDHQVDDPGETTEFESTINFVVEQFKNPPTLNDRWTHYDLSKDFDIWDYTVKSNKSEPGFIVLENVDEDGFGLYSKQWLPEGPPIKNLQINLTTPPKYVPDSLYRIQIAYPKENKTEIRNIRTNQAGSLQLDLSGNGCEVGILTKYNRPDFVVSGYRFPDGKHFLIPGEKQQLLVELLNRKGDSLSSGELKVEVSCSDSSVLFSQPSAIFSVCNGEKLQRIPPFEIQCTKIPPTDGSPAWVKLNLTIHCDSLKFEDDIVVPVWFDVAPFENIKVDDGIPVSLRNLQSDYLNNKVDSAYGIGNGDGIFNPSERILLYKDSCRLRLFSEDPYLVAEDEILVDEMLPGIWPDGFTFSSVVSIADDCPDGHEIEFLGHYETKTHMPMYRSVHWGKIKVQVKKE